MNQLLSTLGMCALLAAAPTLAHEDHDQPQHGGLVAEAGDTQFEIAASGDQLTVYVSNHGNPVATAGVSGKLMTLAGSAKREIALQPAGDNRLSGQGTLVPGAKLLLSIQWPGQKPLQARAVVK